MSYVRVSIKGTLLSTEVWSVNPTFDPTGEFETSVSQSALDSAAQAIADLAIPTGLRAIMGAQTTRTGTQLEVRADADDSLLALSTAISAVGVFGTTTTSLPPQSSLVLSLRTNTPGASGRGRIYWPALSATTDGTGRVNGTQVSNFANDFKTYLTNIDAALTAAFPLIGFDLAVRSRKTHTSPHVVKIQAGNVIDIQRRRRDSLPESYTTVTYP